MNLRLKKKQKSNNMKLLKKLIPLAIGISLSPNAFADNTFVKNANLPTDVKQTCTADIAPWFATKQVTANGWVDAANSTAPIFADSKNNTRCDFYRWGSQMFLWLTSGDRDKHVFNSSPQFYNVSVAKQVSGNAERTFLDGNGPMLLGVRKGKTDNEIELGQAGGGDVLISQKESLVYYGLHTNDVYALYVTGSKVKEAGEPIISSTQFPSTPGQLKDVGDFAKSYGYDIGDLDAMAIELKTSWIDASTLTKNQRLNYVISEAVVPVFDRSSAINSKKYQQWSITSNETKSLALVGMHIVGTVNGHPEMIWSTIEHVDNVPDNTYTYHTNKTPIPTSTHAYDSSGEWNFSSSNISAPTSITASGIVSNYTTTLPKTPTCVGTPAFSNECITSTSKVSNEDLIKPIDILRVDPWGNDQSDSSTISNTTDLVSINVSVLSQLASGDIRGNYIQTGGIWTTDGSIPNNGTDPKLTGSLNLANTTMETFFQFHNSKPKAFNPKNCFGCHSSGGDAVEVSHIYDELQPLEPNSPLNAK